MTPLAIVHDLPVPPLPSSRLDRRRAARVDAILRDPAAEEARIARETLLRGPDEGAARALERSVSHLLAELRAPDGGDTWMRATQKLDDVLRSDRLELLDRDDVPAPTKRLGMRLLHWVNTAIGSYVVWRRAVAQALEGCTTAHVHDLAAGTGGFARYLAKRPIEGIELRLTSSDIDAGFVALGEEAARKEGAAVTFEVRDALDLSDTRGVDLFVCTQATHHLRPGMVVRMIAHAIASAPRGVLIVDLMRSVFSMVGTGALLAVTAPMPLLLHDGILSVRRSYTPAELTLLARLAGAGSIETHMLGAGHCMLHARR
jgi:SAM-dependent methyltransferase